MLVKVKLVNESIQAGKYGEIIGVAPSRARRWCSKGLAVLADDRFELKDLPSRAELDPEWIAAQGNKEAPAPKIELGPEGGKVDKNPTPEGKEQTGDKTEIKTESGKDGGKVDKKPTKKKAK